MTRTKRAAAMTAAALLSATAGVVFTAGPASANTCSVTPAAGIGAVSVRNSPSTSSYAFTLYPGQYLRSHCYSQSGGYYSGCGNGNHWIWVSSGFFDRYVAAGCVRLVVDRVGT